MDRHFLQWHIIHRCNLSCLHCYQEDINALMSLEDMLKVLDRYKQYLKLMNYEGQINLTGGEPLLHPDFFTIASAISQSGIRLGILTNGTLIDDETAGKLAELKPVFVQVSLDGPSETHDAIRGKGQFEKALKGIDSLKRYGIKVLVSFTAMKENYESFSLLAEVCKEHFVDKLWWDRVVTDDANIFLTTKEFKTISKTASKLKSKYSFISNDRALQGLPDKTCGYSCSAGHRLLIVLANGDMMACRRLPFIIGNILTDEDIEKTVRLSPIMNKLSIPDIPSDCKKCPHALVCMGGAKCVTYAQTGKLGIKDINCYRKKPFNPRRNKQ
ncbi:MAG: radical SAM protein [Lachnospiraceae bacterium]|nr:radical SAM protein [Lachnospiraceae bacterium]